MVKKKVPKTAEKKTTKTTKTIKTIKTIKIIKPKTPEKTTSSEKNISDKIEKTNKQPEISIGLIGHVDHGKTTLVQALSSKWTDSHSEEIKRGITIRLGYADVNIYEYPEKTGPEKFGVLETDPITNKKGKLLRRISLVDAPGHESLMATMLCGANIMDGAILMISATEQCPQPQTREHIQALEIVGLKNLIVVQNKIDLISETAAIKNYEQIKEFLKNTAYKNAPIIPMSAIHHINLDILIETIQNNIKTPKRDTTQHPIMYVARSFDINKPGITPEKLVGGVLGGALKQGILKANDEIEILPGYEIEQKNIKIWKPITTKIISINTGGNLVKEAIPGGSLALMTSLDPFVVKSDKLVGSVIGYKGKTPPIWYDLKLETHLLERVVGAKDKLIVELVKLKEIFMLNVNSAATVGVVTELGKNMITCKLKRPVCAEPGSRVTISRNLGQRWRLIGYGIIKK